MELHLIHPTIFLSSKVFGQLKFQHLSDYPASCLKKQELNNHFPPLEILIIRSTGKGHQTATLLLTPQNVAGSNVLQKFPN